MFNIGDLYIGAMDVVCTENADNKSLVYSGTKALLQPSTGRGNSQGQETCSFEEAYVEFPTRWDLHATVVESEIERELSDTCQTNAKQMPNNVYQITNAKYEMLKNCQTRELLLVYKSLNNLAPVYINSLLKNYKPSRNLMSVDQGLLTVPRSNQRTYGDRAFSVAAPKLWNALPLDFRNSGSITLFKCKLKTFLFKKYYL